MTELQLAILDVLWQRGAASVTEILDALRQTRVIEQPTVSTLLGRMQDRNLVTSERSARRAIYRARIGREEVQADVVSEFAGRAIPLFDQDPSALFAGLLDYRNITAEDLGTIRRMIEERERQLRTREAP